MRAALNLIIKEFLLICTEQDILLKNKLVRRCQYIGTAAVCQNLVYYENILQVDAILLYLLVVCKVFRLPFIVFSNLCQIWILKSHTNAGIGLQFDKQHFICCVFNSKASIGVTLNKTTV